MRGVRVARLWSGPGPAESVGEGAEGVEAVRSAAREGGKLMEAWPGTPLSSQSGGSAWCWWTGAAGEAVVEGSATTGCW